MAEPFRRGRLLLGTSGFAYDAWKGSFYPADLKAKDMLAWYARRFSSVEINYTFRRLPTAKAVAEWRAATPPGFVFTVKAPMRITHVRRLAGCEEEVAAFLASIEPLGDRTGPLLFQCPPNLKFDGPRLEAFLALLPAGRRCVFEFREPSWTAARPALAAHGVAWCAADTDEEPAPDDALAAGAFHYLRLRRSEYSPAELHRWAERIDDALRGGRDVYCYFRHEDEAKGPRFANALGEALAARSGRD